MNEWKKQEFIEKAGDSFTLEGKNVNMESGLDDVMKMRIGLGTGEE